MIKLTITRIQEDEVNDIEQQKRIRVQEVKLDKFEEQLNRIKQSIHNQTRNTSLRFQTEINKKWFDLENADDEIKASYESDDIINNYLNKYNKIKITYEYNTISDQLNQHIDNIENAKPEKQVKLNIRPLEKKKIEGDFRKWNTFYETFSDIVNSGQCSEIEKMHYLNNSLEGDAKKVISHLSISNDSYADAMKLLKNRFENKRKTTTSFIDAILEIPQLQSRSATALFRNHC
jgi:Protein of unknown function (DUF1759)